ncbi:hypothetical protein XENORESO_014614, partial [Xenotaenia resolanae]
MYTRTGQVTKGGVVLPVYLCARGSTSLESFHQHMNRFIPGTSAIGCHVQMYLFEGLTRWNDGRAQTAAGAENAGMKCYAGQKQHTLFQLTQSLLGVTLAESYTKPLKYTGELIGMSYLYPQKGWELQKFPNDPDEPDGGEEIILEDDEASEEDRLLDVLEEGLDEGSPLGLTKPLATSTWFGWLTKGRFKKAKTYAPGTVAQPGLESMKRTRTTIQLFAVNQATLSQWYRKRIAMEERTTLMAGVVPLQAPTEAEEFLLPAKGIQGPQPVPNTSFFFRNLQPLQTREKEG